MNTQSLYDAGYEACMTYAFGGVQCVMRNEPQWIEGWNIAVIEIAAMRSRGLVVMR